MFIENSALHFIEADAQDVIAVYRSTSNVTMAYGGREEQPCEAFICVVQEADDVAVYAALSFIRRRNFIIFAPEKKPETRASHEKLVGDALAFLSGWGFEMQSVNLNYSKALKEVILSDLRLVKPAVNARKSPQRKITGEKPAKDGDHALEKGKKEAQAEAKTALEGTSPEPRVNATPSAESSPEILKKPAGVTAAPLTAADFESMKVFAWSPQEPDENPTVSAGLLDFQDVTTSLKAEIERISREKAAAASRARRDLEETREEIGRLLIEKEEEQRLADEELAALKSQMEGLLREKNEVRESASREIEGIRAQIEQLAREKAAEEEAASNEIAALRNELRRLLEAKTEDEISRAEELEALKSEIEQLEGLATEKDAAGSVLCRELEEARAELEQIRKAHESAIADREAELAALRGEADRLRKERLEAEESAEREIADLRNVIAALKEENAAAQSSLALTVAGLKNEVGRLAAEKEQVETAAAAELNAMQDMIRSLVNEIDTIKSHLDKRKRALLDEAENLRLAKAAAEEEAGAELSSLQDETERLKGELQETLDRYALEISDLKSGIERLVEEKRIAEESAAIESDHLRQKAEQVRAEKEEFEFSAARELEAFRAEAERLEGELRQIEAFRSDEISTLTAEVQRLSAEIESLEKDASEAMASVAAKAAQIGSELLDMERLVVEKIAGARSAARMLMVAVSAEEAHPDDNEGETGATDRLAALAQEKDGQPAEKAGRAQEAAAAECGRDNFIAAGESLVQEIVEQPPAAERVVAVPPVHLESAEFTDTLASDVDTTEAELVQLPEGLTAEAASETGFGMPEEPFEIAVVGQEQDPFAFMRSVDDSPVVSRVIAGQSSGPPVNFGIDGSRDALEYRSPEDIIELYQSLNRTRVAMEDHTSVTCDSYLCGIRVNGRPHVYIALYLVDRKSALIYAPERQPDSDEEYAKTMRDGMDFIEIVGFMMDKVDVGGNSGESAKVLGRIPVLRLLPD